MAEGVSLRLLKKSRLRGGTHMKRNRFGVSKK
jgi:hypothetical protein